MFYAAYALGGAAALTVFKTLVIVAAFSLFFRFAGGGLWAGLLLCAAAWAGGTFNERPHIFDPLFLGLLLNWLDREDECFLLLHRHDFGLAVPHQQYLIYDLDPDLGY